MKVLIKKDVFNISRRIKNFDNSYCIVFDDEINKYQVYSTNLNELVEQISYYQLSYVCTLPYNELDERSIRYLYNTSVENIDNIIKQIDDDNKILESQNELKLKQESLLIAESRLRQLTR